MMACQLIFTTGLRGQENVPLDSLLARVLAIPMAEISLEVTSINSELVEKRKILLTEEEIVRIESIVDSVLARYEVIMEDPRHKKFDEINSRELQSFKNEWSNVSVRLEQVQKEMTVKVETLENEKTSLQIPLRQWNLTLEQARNENATQTVLDQIGTTINAIEQIIVDLNKNTAFLQDDLVKVSEKLIASNEIIQTFDVMLDESTIERFKFDKPVIWKDSLYVRDTTSAEPGYFGANMPAIKGFVADNSRKMMVHLGFFIMITIVLISMFRRLQKSVAKKDEKYVSRTRILMSKPFATSLMITFTITLIYYDNIPQVIRSLNAILILVPMTLLIAHNIHQSIKKYIYLLMVIILLVVLHDLTYREDLFSRLIMLVVYTASFFTTISMIRNRSIQEWGMESFSRRVLYNLLYVVGLMMGIAIIANIFGGVYIAEYFGTSTLFSIVIAALIYSFIQVIDGILIMIIYSKGISSLTVIKDFGPTVEKRLTGLVSLAGWTIWVLAVLKEFTIKDDVRDHIAEHYPLLFYHMADHNHLTHHQVLLGRRCFYEAETEKRSTRGHFPHAKDHHHYHWFFNSHCCCRRTDGKTCHPARCFWCRYRIRAPEHIQQPDLRHHPGL
jgi:hypothetical protein